MASTRAVSPWAHGIAVFAGVMMIIGGAFQALEALAAIVNDKYFVVQPDYIYPFDLSVGGGFTFWSAWRCWRSASSY